MEIGLIFLNLRVSDGASRIVFPYWIGDAFLWLPGNSPLIKGRTKTNTGRWVEYTKALERTVLKELGKLHP
jgi:hypothetical protein